MFTSFPRQFTKGSKSKFLSCQFWIISNRPQSFYFYRKSKNQKQKGPSVCEIVWNFSFL